MNRLYRNLVINPGGRRRPKARILHPEKARRIGTKHRDARSKISQVPRKITPHLG